MTRESMLGASKLVAFVPTMDAARARGFYEGVLGLRLVEDAKPFALVFDANGTMLRVTTVRELVPDPFTVLGWDVEPSGAKVAWFKDPDGNALSVTEFAKAG
jgi:catechol 2,3-dioxygenase-like lactoylglutathione lyase family enzyme